MLLAIITSMPTTFLGCLLAFMLWFLIWAPLVALLEYFAHRWIMHKANRWLDPKLGQLRAHGAHHQGSNDHALVDMPLKNCLLLTSPSFLAMGLWVVAGGSISSVIIPAAALLSWTFCYTYLWTRIHRAIHGLEKNWFFRLGPVFRFFRDHHLQHHTNATINYGTVFPWTDYVFLTARDRRTARHRVSRKLPTGDAGKAADPSGSRRSRPAAERTQSAGEAQYHDKQT